MPAASRSSWSRRQLVTVRDNGRGIPVDPHPKFPDKSALEVILTTLHSGGKFGGKAYETSGGLHGVGVSVVNALSDALEVEVARDRKLWKQGYSRGKPEDQAQGSPAPVQNRRGTTIRFQPDTADFRRRPHFKPAPALSAGRSKAYLFRGVEIRWRCDPGAAAARGRAAGRACCISPAACADCLAAIIDGSATLSPPRAFAGEAEFQRPRAGQVEWAVAWPDGRGGLLCTPTATPFPRRRAAPRSRAARGADPQRSGLGRAERQPPRRADHRRGRARRRGGASCRCSCAIRSSRARPRRSSPRPRRTRLVETALQRPLRPLAGRRSARRAAACWPSSSSAPRSACAAARSKELARKSADAPAAPARQAGRLHARRAPTAPRSSWSRATAPAARPSRRATAKPRRSCRCAARSSTSPSASADKLRAQPGTDGPDRRRWAAASATALRARTSCATGGSSS